MWTTKYFIFFKSQGIFCYSTFFKKKYFFPQYWRRGQIKNNKIFYLRVLMHLIGGLIIMYIGVYIRKVFYVFFTVVLPRMKQKSLEIYSCKIDKRCFEWNTENFGLWILFEMKSNELRYTLWILMLIFFAKVFFCVTEKSGSHDNQNVSLKNLQFKIQIVLGIFVWHSDWFFFLSLNPHYPIHFLLYLFFYLTVRHDFFISFNTLILL